MPQVVAYRRIKTMGKYKTVIQKSGHDCLREVVVYESF